MSLYTSIWDNRLSESIKNPEIYAGEAKSEWFKRQNLWVIQFKTNADAKRAGRSYEKNSPALFNYIVVEEEERMRLDGLAANYRFFRYKGESDWDTQNTLSGIRQVESIRSRLRNQSDTSSRDR